MSIPKLLNLVSLRSPQVRWRVRLVGSLLGTVLAITAGSLSAQPNGGFSIPMLPSPLFNTALGSGHGLCTREDEVALCAPRQQPKFELNKVSAPSKVRWSGVQDKDKPTYVICRLNHSRVGKAPTWECVELYSNFGR